MELGLHVLLNVIIKRYIYNINILLIKNYFTI